MIHNMNNESRVASAVADGTESGEARGNPGLLEVAFALQGQIESALESVGLSVPKYMALRRLADAGAPVSLSGLADKQGCVRSNITQLIDRLETDGLVKRMPDPSDRRAVLATLTPVGVDRLAAARVAVDEVQAELVARMPEKDRPAFTRVLEAIRAK